jgi:hypothetical protein
MRAALGGAFAVGVWTSVALAAPPFAPATVPIRAEQLVEHAEAVSTLYLNRCRGGCTIVKQGINDARTRASTVPEGENGQEFTISEFAWGDEEWDAIVRCVKEVYSPYDIVITDELPAPGVSYNESIIAGVPAEIGWRGVGGVAPVLTDCQPYNYTINYTFANSWGPRDRVFELCAVAAQESGHSFGLDHTFSFADGSSGCKDPMTYRGDCGGQKFFRNDIATCGEYQPRSCTCGGTQNSHQKLVSVLGPGTPITAPPTVAITQPSPGATIDSSVVISATAFAQRGIDEIELWLNGYRWATLDGVGWGPSGQPEATYSWPLPAGVPDGVIDIVVKAKDDIDVTTTTEAVRVTKGAPCVSAESCAPGQRCDEEGRCLWDPPVGELGEPCSYPQFCKTETCSAWEGQQRCTQGCILGISDSCPAGFACVEGPGQSVTMGVCWPAEALDEDDGWCSASNSAESRTAFGLLALALVLITRRRR